MSKIGFIGAGNMGYAMLKGALNCFGRDNITYTDVNQTRLEIIKNETGIEYSKTNSECLLNSKIIILAVKPQYYADVLNEIKTDITTEHVVVSIAPGINIEYLKGQLGIDIKVARAMPNTPALVGAGVSAVSFSNDPYTDEEKKIVMDFFRSFGEVVELPEKLMDAVVPISGSSPAYVYMFIEAMADAGVLFGLSRDDAYKLAAGSVLGSAKMVLETGIHPGKLKDAVCSPGGTTIEAVAELEKNGFRSAIIEAMKSCYDKTKSF